MTRIRVFQHVPHEGLGSMEPLFRAMGASLAYTRFSQGDPAPDPASFDMLVIMGGPMGVYEENLYPWLREEKQAMRVALDANKPTLGICLGAQLLAEIYGGKVSRNRHKEIGWWPVERLPKLEWHWAASCFPERFPSFHWHGDTFSIPPGAVSLFRSKGCATQGFALGDRMVGLQFHPEITPEIAVNWMENGTEELVPGPYIQKPEKIRGRTGDYADNNGWLAKLCRALLKKARPSRSASGG